jgi:uncharacterized membrane protein YfcA
VNLPPTDDIVIVVVGALVAGFVNGLSGTGYALAALGFWLHAMSPITAAPLAALCGVAGHIQSLPRIWSGVSWPRLWPYLVAGLIGVPIGTALLDRVQVQPLKLGVGVLLIVYVSWIGFMRRPPIVRGGGRLADAAVAFVGGVMGGLASLSGPAPMVWAQLRGWDKHELRAVNQPFNMSVLAFSVITAGVAGFLDLTFFLWAAMCIPSTLIGARFGLALYGRINDQQFRRIVLILLGLSGVTLIASAL